MTPPIEFCCPHGEKGIKKKRKAVKFSLSLSNVRSYLLSSW